MRKIYHHQLKQHMPIKFIIHHHPHHVHSLNSSMEHMNITSGSGSIHKHYEHSKKIKPLKFKM